MLIIKFFVYSFVLPRHFSPCNQRCSLMAKHISNPLASIPSTSIKQIDIPTTNILKKETETKVQNKVILLLFACLFIFSLFSFQFWPGLLRLMYIIGVHFLYKGNFVYSSIYHFCINKVLSWIFSSESILDTFHWQHI